MADVGIGRIQSGHVRAQSFGDGPVAREDRLRHLFVLRLHGGRQACDARAQRVAFGAQLGLIGLIEFVGALGAGREAGGQACQQGGQDQAGEGAGQSGHGAA